MKNEIKKLFEGMKVDDDKVREYEERREREIAEQRRFFLVNSTPQEFINADINKTHIKIKEFLKSDKRFCWIYGIKGSGKTYSIYAVRNHLIMSGYIYFNICMEGELNYDIDFRRVDAVDNLCISDSKIKYLSDYYFNLFDFCWKNHKKLFLTSTKTHTEWLKLLSSVNMENAEAIASRMSNMTEIIELTSKDRRRDNEIK